VLKPTLGTPSSAKQLPVQPQAPVPASASVPSPAAATKGVFASVPGQVSTEQPISKAASPDQTTFAADLSVPDAAIDQFASPAHFSSRPLVEAKAGLSGVNQATETNPPALSATNGKDGIKGSSDDAADLKLHTSPASNQAKLQKNSSEATPSDNQNQNSSVSQGQDTVRPVMNVVNHAVAASATAQTMVNTSPAQNSAIPASATAHAAKTPDNAAPASAAAPQALPVINTAKLIQSMGQSEMRVGMRSTEFGSISISTSSTRDLVSAQISLEHGELARTLAVHLPEIQARLGGNQPMDVRIDMNGASAGQIGTSSGMPDGSAGQSRGGRQQAGNHADSSYSDNPLAGQQLSTAALAATMSENALNARLDIRV
jgi:hypothetical protein